MNTNNNESWKCHDCRHYMDDNYGDYEICCVDNDEYIGRDKCHVKSLRNHFTDMEYQFIKNN